jgi:hypothetical protein
MQLEARGQSSLLLLPVCSLVLVWAGRRLVDLWLLSWDASGAIKEFFNSLPVNAWTQPSADSRHTPAHS